MGILPVKKVCCRPQLMLIDVSLQEPNKNYGNSCGTTEVQHGDDGSSHDVRYYGKLATSPLHAAEHREKAKLLKHLLHTSSVREWRRLLRRRKGMESI